MDMLDGPGSLLPPVRKCNHLATGVNIRKLSKTVSGSLSRAKCGSCKSNAENALWICLRCGLIGCGSSDAKHALEHWKSAKDSLSKETHCLVASINQGTPQVWCYECDDFVVHEGLRNPLVAEVKALIASSSSAKKVIMLPKADTRDLTASFSKKTKIKPPSPGLLNLGNTCFFNSVMQCMVYTDALTPYYQNGLALPGPKVDDVVPKALSKAFLNFLNVVKIQFRSGTAPTVSPVGVFTQLKTKFEIYRSMGQQDAHELLRTLLGGIKDEQTPRDENGKEIRMGEPGCADFGSIFVDTVFGGKLVSVVLCASCRSVTYRFEEFLDLSLSLIMAGESSSDKKKGMMKLVNKLTPSGSKKATPSNSRPPSPFQINSDSNLEAAIEKLNMSLSVSDPKLSKSESNLLKPGPSASPPQRNAAQVQLTERLFRAIDTVSAQQGLPAGSVAQPTSKSLSLAKCLENFLSCDILEGSNGLVCEKCNGLPPTTTGFPNASTPDLSAETQSSRPVQLNLTPNTADLLTDELSDTSDNSNVVVVNFDQNYDEADSDLDDSLVVEDTLPLDTVTQHIPLTSSMAPPQPQVKKPQILTNGVKRYLIHQFPKVLALHLKRFERVGSSGRSKKLDVHVAFDEILDMGMYLSPDEVVEKLMRKSSTGGPAVAEDVVVAPQWRNVNNGLYRLYGVVVHAGSLFGGHYVAYVRVKVPDDVELPESFTSVVKGREFWIYASDSVVKLTTLEEVLKQQAYILFYEHVDSSEGA
ncbi:hypothetical protein BJ741DRAFT_588737 [Chytriomyces cf. hyalinus JEL632]|nr:hypothetical protein BJ741DRAFT_588737 [Chytriomyces cf. hyalinus JEL632]